MSAIAQGTAVTDISLAINDNRSREPANKATFVEVTFWDKAAEIICEYMKKGKSMLVEGRLATDSWEDRESGKMRSKLKVVASNFQFTESAPQNQQSRPPQGGYGNGSNGHRG